MASSQVYWEHLESGLDSLLGFGYACCRSFYRHIILQNIVDPGGRSFVNTGGNKGVRLKSKQKHSNVKSTYLFIGNLIIYNNWLVLPYAPLIIVILPCCGSSVRTLGQFSDRVGSKGEAMAPS